MTDLTKSNVRSVLKLIGAYFVSKGIADDSTVETVVAGINALAGVILSYQHHK